MYRPVCYSRPRLLYIIWMLMLTALPYFPLISEASQVQQSLPYARHHIDINAENVQMKAGLDDKRTESHRSSSTFADIYPPTPSPASPASSASSVSLPPPLSPSALSASSSLLNLRSRDKRRGRIRGRRRRREVEAEDTSSGGNRRGPQSLLQTRERRRAGLEAESMLQSKSTVTRTRNRASMSTDPADLKSGPAQYKVECFTLSRQSSVPTSV